MMIHRVERLKGLRHHRQSTRGMRLTRFLILLVLVLSFSVGSSFHMTGSKKLRPGSSNPTKIAPPLSPTAGKASFPDDRSRDIHVSSNDGAKTTLTQAEEQEFNRAVRNTLAWVGSAILFGCGLWLTEGATSGQEFFAGYLVEQSLSVDNLFVFLLLFDYFKVPAGSSQNRVLNWGIIGAIGMRAVMISVGAAALENYRSVLLVFAAILIGSSIKFFVGGKEHDDDPNRNPIVNFAKNLIQSTDKYDGDKFFTMEDGIRKATPLLICMVAVELSDVVFAVDSIPAVFGVTEVGWCICPVPCVLCDSSSLAHPTDRCYAESTHCVFIQYFCNHGPSKPVHYPLQGSD